MPYIRLHNACQKFFYALKAFLAFFHLEAISKEIKSQHINKCAVVCQLFNDMTSSFLFCK